MWYSVLKQATQANRLNLRKANKHVGLRGQRVLHSDHMKTLRLEERYHSGPARSIRPGTVNQDNIFGPLRGIRLSESSHVEAGRQDQHRGCDQSGSVHLREFHFYLLVKLNVAIKPEQPWLCNWTMVLAVPWYQLIRGALGTCYERGGLPINLGVPHQ